MAVSHKYRTFDQLLEDVTVDFRTHAVEGMIEPQQLIKVATRVNYDLGLRIHRTKDPGDPKQCVTPTDCKDVCVVQTCPKTTTVPAGRGTKEVTTYDEHIVVQFVGADQYRTYSNYMPLRISQSNTVNCDCPNVNMQADNIAEIKDGFLLTNFTTGHVYINYQGAMEDNEGNLLVLDHPYCNEYYEYALKERILENMVFAGENVVNQLQYVKGQLRASRNNALGFINTPGFEEMRKIWEVNRKAQYNNYYNMFKSHPTLGY